MRLIDADKIDFSTVFIGASGFAQDIRDAAQTLIKAQPTVDIKKQIYAELEAHKKLIEDGAGGEYVVELVQIADCLGQFEIYDDVIEDLVESSNWHINKDLN